MDVILGIIILIVMIVIGVSIPFAFGVAMIYYYFLMGGSPATTISVGFSQLNSLVLLAIPMFVIAGGIIEKGKLGDALVGFIDMFIGHIKGGLGAVSVIASAVFGAITGSCAATLSCIGSVMMPKLRKAGYDDGFATALLVNAGPLGLLIPPSADQILYAWSAGESVLACFLSTVIPGIILAILLCIINLIYAGRSTTVVAQERVKFLRSRRTAREGRHPGAPVPGDHPGRNLRRIHDPHRGRRHLHHLRHPRRYLHLQGHEVERFKEHFH